MLVRLAIWTVNHTQKVKTTILIDKHLLDQFKRLASAKHGTSRTLSAEFEKALRASSPSEILTAAATRLNLAIDRYPSLDEIIQKRPRVDVSAGTTVREMRDGRGQRVLGHK